MICHQRALPRNGVSAVTDLCFSGTEFEPRTPQILSLQALSLVPPTALVWETGNRGQQPVDRAGEQFHVIGLSRLFIGAGLERAGSSSTP